MIFGYSEGVFGKKEIACFPNLVLHYAILAAHISYRLGICKAMRPIDDAHGSMRQAIKLPPPSPCALESPGL